MVKVATYGYLVYLLRANAPYRPRALQRLSELGEDRRDLLDLLTERMNEVGAGYHRETTSPDGYRVKRIERSGRTLDIRVNKGPEGTTGEVIDIETHESQETTERQALLAGLRALFVIPKDCYFGLLFVERIGVRHLKELLDRLALHPAALESGALIRVEAFAEASDWQRVLNQQETLRISELMEYRPNDDPSTPKDLTVRLVAEGPRIRRASSKVKEHIFARLQRREAQLTALASAADLERRRVAQADAFTVQDETRLQALNQSIGNTTGAPPVDDELATALKDLIPVETDAMTKHRRFEVAFGVERPERTFVIEGSAIPQFVYELGSRLTDDALKSTWEAHSESILKARGVNLPRGWNGKTKA